MKRKLFIAAGIILGLAGLAACRLDEGAVTGSSETESSENPSNKGETSKPEANPDDTGKSKAPAVNPDTELVLFDAAYLGYVGGLFDEGFEDGFPKWLKENNQALLNEYPSIAEIDSEHIIGGAGHLYYIAPTDKNATLAVNRIKWSEEKADYEAADVLYRSEAGEPVLLFANLDGVAYEPDTEVCITDNSGNTCNWYPSLDASSFLSPCVGEDGKSIFRDISKYSHSAAPEHSAWLDDGWLGPKAVSLSGTDDVGFNWFVDDTAWETSRKASFILTFYPGDENGGRAELSWLYDGEKEFEEEWSGFWSLEEKADCPSRLTLSLSRVGGESLDSADGPMYISETYPVLISPSGEEMVITRSEDTACLPFMSQSTTAIVLYLGTWTE